MLNLLTRFRGPSPKTQKGYEALVIRVADGEEINESDIGEYLDGRAIEDFQKDVKTYLSRKQAVADLERAKEMAAEQARLDADVREAKAAFDNHPLQKAMIELQELGRRFEESRINSSQHSGRVVQLRGRANGVLSRTASKSIGDNLAGVSGEIRHMENERQKVALTDSEERACQVMQRDLAELPSRIAAESSNVERATLTARLLAQRKALERFDARRAEADRLTGKIAKLQTKMEKAGSVRMDPTVMEFTSKPARATYEALPTNSPGVRRGPMNAPPLGLK